MTLRQHIDTNVTVLIEYRKSVESSLLISVVAAIASAIGLTYALLKSDINILYLSLVILAPAIVAFYRAYSEFRNIVEEAFIAGQSLGEDEECEKCVHKYSEHNHDEEDLDFSCDINGCECQGFLEYE